MTGKSPLMASEAQQGALMVLAGSRDRGEADRARAVLLTLISLTGRHAILRGQVQWRTRSFR